MITVIIPVYRGHLIEEVLLSVKAQIDVSIEKIIIVLNQSEIKNKSNYINLSHKFPQLEVTEIEVNNVSMARNVGLLRSSTEYTLFLDEDCVFASVECLQKMLLKAQPHYVVGVGTLFVLQKGFLKEKFYNFKINLWMQSRDRFLIAGGVGLYKTVVVRQLQFDSSIAYGGSETSLHNRIYEKDIGSLELVLEKQILHRVNASWLQLFRKAKWQKINGIQFSFLPPIKFKKLFRLFIMENDFSFFEKVQIALILFAEKIWIFF